MALRTMPLQLNFENSKRLLAELEKQEYPWGLLYKGSGVFVVEIDGTETVHSLDLSSPDGWWCMHTRLEI